MIVRKFSEAVGRILAVMIATFYLVISVVTILMMLICSKPIILAGSTIAFMMATIVILWLISLLFKTELQIKKNKIMKYKVGDKVKIKSFDWFKEINYSKDDLLRIEKYCDKEAIITEIDQKYKGYHIDIDNGEYWWCELVFDDIDTEKPSCQDNEKFSIPDNAFIIHPINWEQRRYELAKDFVASLIGCNSKLIANDIMDRAIFFADKIIERLKTK